VGFSSANAQEGTKVVASNGGNKEQDVVFAHGRRVGRWQVEVKNKRAWSGLVLFVAGAGKHQYVRNVGAPLQRHPMAHGCLDGCYTIIHRSCVVT
jgi:hypothetical protein